jgi:hypothetical protein
MHFLTDTKRSSTGGRQGSHPPRRWALGALAASMVVEGCGGLAGENIEIGTGREALLQQVGPIDNTLTGGGFPSWFSDSNGLRLALCLDANDPLCIAAPLPDPNAPRSFPTNFPDESFWWSGDTQLTTANGGDALLIMGLEAAFLNGLPAPGEQIAFTRIRLRVDNLPAGHYVVTHPFGVNQYDIAPGQADGRRSINDTVDIGSFVGGDFAGALAGRVGPFLVWDDPSALPDGYLGDPNVPHVVVGSPFGTNFFQIEGPPGAFAGSPDVCTDSTGETRDDCIVGDLFAVQAKVAVNAGLSVIQAEYTNGANGQFIDILVSSATGQNIFVSGTGVASTQLLDGGNGTYFVRVFYEGGLPTDLVASNLSDEPPTQRQIGVLVDDVQVASAVYFISTRQLRVTASSGDVNATLALSGLTASSVIGSPGGPFTIIVDNLATPPVEVVVVSSSGGRDSKTVVIDNGPR